MKVPSDMIAVGDTPLSIVSESTLKRGWNLNGPAATCGDSRIAILGKSWTPYYDPMATKATKQRHRALFNIAFCDGHAESIKHQKLWEPTDQNLQRWNNDHEPHSNLFR